MNMIKCKVNYPSRLSLIQPETRGAFRPSCLCVRAVNSLCECKSGGLTRQKARVPTGVVQWMMATIAFKKIAQSLWCAAT